MRPSILLEVFEERQKQISKGYDAAHDDQYKTELADAVACLATSYHRYGQAKWIASLYDKYERQYRKRLIIAMALLWAEIERLERSRNLANPDYEPTTEDLADLMHGAFAHIREAHEKKLRS